MRPHTILKIEIKISLEPVRMQELH